MASKKVVADGETKDVIDEATVSKLESEDGGGNGILPHHSTVILDSDVDEEIELFLKQELKSEQNVSEDGVTQKGNINEKSCKATDTGIGKVAGLVSPCRVVLHRVDDSSECKEGVQIENNVPEKRNDRTEILHKKRSRDDDDDVKEVDYGLGIVVEGGTTTEHSDNVSGSTNKTDRNESEVKAKDCVEAKSMETTTAKPYLMYQDLSPLWGSYILAVKGIPPKESGRLKAVLNDVLGINRHRVRPRQRGDSCVYLHFITLEDMKVAKETLNAQSIRNYKLTVTVESVGKCKSKHEDGDKEPASKKMKQDPVVQFYEEDYNKQVEFKVNDFTARLQGLEKDIIKNYPTYSRLIRQRRLQHDGVICAVDKLKECPANKRVAFSCWFAVGVSEDNGQLALGIYQGGRNVRKLSLVKHNYPDHVVMAAEVFEQFLLAKESRKICRKLLIYTNHTQDLMLLVFVHDTSHIKQVGNEMKEFFMSGDGAKCKVTSIHIKVMKSNDNIKELVVGVPCLQETVAGIELQLPPVKNLWNTIHGAEMLCQALEELLAPSKKTTVLDIGCGIGLLGLYLSKKAGEVLGVDVAVDVAAKNATLNGATDCRYFAGDAEVTIPALAKKIKHDSVCAVITCCFNNSYRSWRAMEELRRIRTLNRLVLVGDKTMSSSAILALNNPSSDKKMGNPFFPSKVVPLDSLPNSRDYVLLVLLERVNSKDIQKFRIDSTSVTAESEMRTKGSASGKPYERDSMVRLQQGNRRWLPNTLWDRGPFSQQRYDAGAGAVHNRLLQNTASYERLQTADVLRACVGTVNSLTDVEMGRQMEEDYRRQMIEEEEQREWLAKEEQRRLREEMHFRQVQEEDWIRWVQDERARRIQEEECRRIEEEEWRTRVEEERMRQIQEERMRELREVEEERVRRIQEERKREMQEEERMRRVQEERMREIQEEEERMRRVQEERVRQIQEQQQLRRLREIQEEEERMRRVQEERMRQVLEEERMRRMREIQEKEERMRRVQEERMRQIQEEEERMRQVQEERIRQIHGVEHARRIQEQEYRRTEEEEWRRQVGEAEWRREMLEEQRRMKEEEWRRQIQEGERRKHIQKEEQNRVKEEEWRRKMQRESQKGPVLVEKRTELAVEEEKLRKPVREERERELVRGSVVRSRNDLVQDLIADTLRAAAIPQLSVDAAEKVKHLVAEAIRTAGAMEQGNRPGGSQNREVSGISREDMTVSRFGASDKELSPSRHMEEEYLRYIREVESAYDHSHDTSGGTAGRYSKEKVDLKSQHQAVGTKSSENLPSLLDLKLKNYGNQARDLVRRDEDPTFSSVTDSAADIYMRRSDLDHEKWRSPARRDRMDVRGAGNRNRPEHGRKDRRHVVFDRPSTRPWSNSN